MFFIRILAPRHPLPQGQGPQPPQLEQVHHQLQRQLQLLQLQVLLALQFNQGNAIVNFLMHSIWVKHYVNDIFV